VQDRSLGRAVSRFITVVVRVDGAAGGRAAAVRAELRCVPHAAPALPSTHTLAVILSPSTYRPLLLPRSPTPTCMRALLHIDGVPYVVAPHLCRGVVNAFLERHVVKIGAFHHRGGPFVPPAHSLCHVGVPSITCVAVYDFLRAAVESAPPDTVDSYAEMLLGLVRASPATVTAAVAASLADATVLAGRVPAAVNDVIVGMFRKAAGSAAVTGDMFREFVEDVVNVARGKVRAEVLARYM
jgi:hypothetical protein